MSSEIKHYASQQDMTMMTGAFIAVTRMCVQLTRLNILKNFVYEKNTFSILRLLHNQQQRFVHLEEVRGGS